MLHDEKLHCKQITNRRNLGRNKTRTHPDGEMASGYRFPKEFPDSGQGKRANHQYSQPVTSTVQGSNTI